MIRAFRAKSIAVFAAGIALTGTLFVEPPAYGNDSPSNREMAERFRRPGAPLDPVLSALASGHLVRQVSALEDGAAKVAEVTRGFALSGLDLAAIDVTSTEAGRQEVAAFVAGLSRRGIDAGATRFTVYSLPSIKEADDAVAGREASSDDLDGGPLASSLVVPEGTVVELVGAVFEGGQLQAKTVLSASAQPPSSAPPRHQFSGMASPGDSATFVRAGGIGCFHRKQNNTAWYDPCQEFWQHENDHDPNRDYWASPMWGTGKSKSVWTLSGLEAASRRTDGTAHQDWVDWDPGADGKQNCQSQSVSVSYAGASVSVDKQHCELWDISKGEHPAQFSNWWRGDVWRSERETAAAILTSTRGGEVPTDNFDFDFYAHP
jgi:hypothetical protein